MKISRHVDTSILILEQPPPCFYQVRGIWWLLAIWPISPSPWCSRCTLSLSRILPVIKQTGCFNCVKFPVCPHTSTNTTRARFLRPIHPPHIGKLQTILTPYRCWFPQLVTVRNLIHISSGGPYGRYHQLWLSLKVNAVMVKTNVLFGFLQEIHLIFKQTFSSTICTVQYHSTVQ